MSYTSGRTIRSSKARKSPNHKRETEIIMTQSIAGTVIGVLAYGTAFIWLRSQLKRKG